MTHFNGKLKVLKDDVDTWELASRMLKVYDEARKTATGNAECRKISRMQAVVEEVLDEFVELVAEAERESV